MCTLMGILSRDMAVQTFLEAACRGYEAVLLVEGQDELRSIFDRCTSPSSSELDEESNEITPLSTWTQNIYNLGERDIYTVKLQKASSSCPVISHSTLAIGTSAVESAQQSAPTASPGSFIRPPIGGPKAERSRVGLR
ncbi:hypothetical protein BDW02DRAFT_130593 [Decorospora gaudefroyi]|uniref:Uncharacterized protein n=1 Tax=Decorospora gaudefroyi TaxID=184978 RepID=A0A6A5KGY9_9PLEO|nr:hypothetical protein BDW02DRAFT_130593 [Decorospora gaudefroyi]